MEQPERFRINTPTVIHEVIDDEAVIVNMHSGHYYSLSRVGADIWRLLDKGCSVEQIRGVIESAYPLETPRVAAAVKELMAQLQEEQLIVPESEPTGRVDETQISLDSSMSNGAFELPLLEKFCDMEELLLLDPIHEVSEAGWPSAEGDPEDNPT